jgi:hypothetical protein
MLPDPPPQASWDSPFSGEMVPAHWFASEKTRLILTRLVTNVFNIAAADPEFQKGCVVRVKGLHLHNGDSTVCFHLCCLLHTHTHTHTCARCRVHLCPLGRKNPRGGDPGPELALWVSNGTWEEEAKGN